MKKKIVIISLVLAVIVAFVGVGIYSYISNINKEKNNNILFKPVKVKNYKTQPDTLNLTNNIVLGDTGVYINLNTEKPSINKIKVSTSDKLGKLRNYILSWYNDQHQMSANNVNVKYIVPKDCECQNLFKFSMNQDEINNFIKTYGANNIMISVVGSGVCAQDTDVVKPDVVINGTPAYGFSLFENATFVKGDTRFYYGFVTADGVVVSAHDLKQYGRLGQVQIISTGQKVDFDGSNKGQGACLV